MGCVECIEFSQLSIAARLELLCNVISQNYNM